MKDILNFLNKNGMVILIIIMTVVMINQCSIKRTEKRIAKFQAEVVSEMQRRDSVTVARLDDANRKLDSTLISNGAVISANRQTSEAINSKKQNIIVRIDK